MENQALQEEVMYLKMKMKAKKKDVKKMEEQYDLIKKDQIKQNKKMKLAGILRSSSRSSSKTSEKMQKLHVELGMWKLGLSKEKLK